ncbi:YraN family protein [Chitinimonas sp. BJYL2]|uniref:YraN family protein n=1 Tax=Chitinimonas sp. BJYL2 TaxID=2976696 RepID=UPI0022B57590|nr:YraN family protein [Chitinimonas sp. BJYL2]
MSISKGAAAESLAADFLAAQGLRLLGRNWRCRQGELDLIADDRGTLVFVEVRSRKGGRFGDAADSITASKQAKLVAAAQHYLATLSRVPPCRFDAVLLDGDAAPRWLRNIIEL